MSSEFVDSGRPERRAGSKDVLLLCRSSRSNNYEKNIEKSEESSDQVSFDRVLSSDVCWPLVCGERQPIDRYCFEATMHPDCTQQVIM